MDINLKYFPAPNRLNSDDGFNLVNDILFVIVLYNTSLSNSKTYETLKSILILNYGHTHTDLLVCDNSYESQRCIGEGSINMYYIHDKSNPGVSASYNRAAKLARSINKKWILVLDQDTDLPRNCVENYLAALTNSPDFPVYAPLVMNKELILSPCKYKFYRGSHFKLLSPGVHKLRNVNVLNSGLLIDLDAFDRVGGYNEKVWLYFSDFVFFNKLKKYFHEFVVLDCKLEHDISSSDYSDVGFSLIRFKYYCEGAKAACQSEESFIAYVSYVLTIGLRSIKMFLRFKDIKFLKIFYSAFFV